MKNKKHTQLFSLNGGMCLLYTAARWMDGWGDDGWADEWMPGEDQVHTWGLLFHLRTLPWWQQAPTRAHLVSTRLVFSVRKTCLRPSWVHEL